MSEEDDKIWQYCPNCDEDYHVPEQQEDCPVCGKKLEGF